MNKLKVETRDLSMKPKYLLKEGIVPGSIYGKSLESTPIRASYIELEKKTSQAGELYEVEVNGSKYVTKIFELQTNPVTGQFIHFSLVELPKGVSNDLDIPVTTVGNAKGEDDGGTVVLMNDYLTLNGLMKDMPQTIKVDVSALEIGDKITVGDLKLSSKVKATMDADEVVVVCRPPATVAGPESDESEQPTEVINQEEDIDTSKEE